MTTARVWSLALCLLGVAAGLSCGGRASFDESGGSGATGSGATRPDTPTAGRTAGGSRNGVPHGGSTAAGSSSGGSRPSDPMDECTGFADDAPSAVVVRILNTTGRGIHVGALQGNCGIVPLFQVADATGEPISEPGFCRFSCQERLERGGGGCPAICLTPKSVYLAAGESTFIIWEARSEQQSKLPESCVPAPDRFDLQCQVARALEAGTYTFTAQAGTTLDCSDSGGDCSACTQDPSGGCTTPGSVIAGTLIRASTTVELDASYGVGSVGGLGGPTREVVLAFKE